MRKTGALAMIVAKPYWREEDARVVVDALERSGQSVAAFSRRHGVSAHRVTRWRSKLAASALVSLVEVQVIDGERGATTTGERVGEVQVVLGNGRRLAVRAGFDGELLSEVARCVERWPC